MFAEGESVRDKQCREKINVNLNDQFLYLGRLQIVEEMLESQREKDSSNVHVKV